MCQTEIPTGLWYLESYRLYQMVTAKLNLWKCKDLMANSVTPGQTASDIDYPGQKLDIQPWHLMVPVFGVSDKANFKPVSSATKTSFKIEISHVTSLHMILSKKRITKALIRLCGCTGCSAPVLVANLWRQVFSRWSPYHISFILKFKCAYSK